MSRDSDRRRRKAKKERKRHTASVARVRQQRQSTPDYSAWPLVRAYVPMEDCFRATGCGTAAVVRRRPDGTLISSFFDLQLMDGGLKDVFGKDEHPDEADVDELIKAMADV